MVFFCFYHTECRGQSSISPCWTPYPDTLLHVYQHRPLRLSDDLNNLLLEVISFCTYPNFTQIDTISVPEYNRGDNRDTHLYPDLCILDHTMS